MDDVALVDLTEHDLVQLTHRLDYNPYPKLHQFTMKTPYF